MLRQLRMGTLERSTTSCGRGNRRQGIFVDGETLIEEAS